MSGNKIVFLFGYSGHAYVIIESFLATGFTIAGYFDYQEALSNPFQIPYYGFEGTMDVKSIVKNSFVFPSVGDNNIRAKLISLFERQQLNQYTLIDPSASVSPTAEIQLSTYIGKNANINAKAIIGKGVIVNTAAVVEHECEVQDFCHIAPAAVLCGNVRIGEASFIGAHSVVRNNTTICSDVILGAGSVVVKNIIQGGIYYGNPCNMEFQ